MAPAKLSEKGSRIQRPEIFAKSPPKAIQSISCDVHDMMLWHNVVNQLRPLFWQDSGLLLISFSVLPAVFVADRSGGTEALCHFPICCQWLKSRGSIFCLDDEGQKMNLRCSEDPRIWHAAAAAGGTILRKRLSRASF